MYEVLTILILTWSIYFFVVVLVDVRFDVKKTDQKNSLSRRTILDILK